MRTDNDNLLFPLDKLLLFGAVVQNMDWENISAVAEAFWVKIFSLASSLLPAVLPSSVTISTASLNLKPKRDTEHQSISLYDVEKLE